MKERGNYYFFGGVARICGFKTACLSYLDCLLLNSFLYYVNVLILLQFILYFFTSVYVHTFKGAAPAKGHESGIPEPDTGPFMLKLNALRGAGLVKYELYSLQAVLCHLKPLKFEI